MGYRLVALDIDGTIRSTEHPLSSRTRRTIARVMDAGVVVTLATGRMFQPAVQSTSELNIRSPIVSFQGAHVADPTTGEVLWHMPLTVEMASMALDELDSWGMQVLAYHGDQVYVNDMTTWVESYGQRNRVTINVVDDLKGFAVNEFTRLVVVGDEDKIHRLETNLNSDFQSQLHVTRSLPHFCEILHPDGGKDKALAWLCNYLGIRQDEVIAFGNGYNDVHMLSWAGLGVAIGGAVPEVLDVSDRVAPPIEEDGAAQVIENLLDQGLIG